MYMYIAALKLKPPDEFTHDLFSRGQSKVVYIAFFLIVSPIPIERARCVCDALPRLMKRDFICIGKVKFYDFSPG